MGAKKQKDPLTDAQYVKKTKKDDCVCPFCGSDNLDGEGVDVQKGGAQQEVTCQDCCASWYDNYVLTGYTVINGPEPKDDDDAG
jgi:transposase-like protein